VEAVSAVHKIGAGFSKSAWYDGITPGREPGIFAMRDPHQHSARRRLFARAFSVSSLLASWEPEIRQKTSLAVQKIQNDARGAGADVFKWWTLMTTDVIAHLSFGESFHMLEQGKVSEFLRRMDNQLLRTLANAIH
jgi:cytochrome P450